jgi:hypothetical protein
VSDRTGETWAAWPVIMAMLIGQAVKGVLW